MKRVRPNALCARGLVERQLVPRNDSYMMKTLSDETLFSFLVRELDWSPAPQAIDYVRRSDAGRRAHRYAKIPEHSTVG